MILPELNLKNLVVYKVAEGLKHDMENDTVSAKKLKKYVHELKLERKMFDFVKRTDNLYSKNLLKDIFKIYNITENRYMEMTLALAKYSMTRPKVVKVAPIDAVDTHHGIYVQYQFEMIVPESFDETMPHNVKELSQMVQKNKAFICGYESLFVKKEDIKATPEQIEESHYYSMPIMCTLQSRRFKKAIIEDIKRGKLYSDYKKYILAYRETMDAVKDVTVQKISYLKNLKNETPLKCQKEKLKSEILELQAITR